MMVPKKQEHIPVLTGEVLKYLDPSPGDTYLDLTAGYGGHASLVLDRTLHAPAVLVDRDEQAIKYLKKRFRQKSIGLMHTDFLSASKELLTKKEQFDLILADLGLSSPHLNTASRGFAIIRDGPLDMRMDIRQTLTAEIIVNTYDEAELTTLIKRYGEEPGAKRIARAITASRPIKTTTKLAEVITQASSARRGRIHPATRTFQALRIAVNDEIGQLEKSLPIWIELLASGGRIVVISFHSLEDRLVKRAFNEAAGDRYDSVLSLLTKQPVTPGQSEIVSNPRARSAKLRAAAKIKTK